MATAQMACGEPSLTSKYSPEPNLLGHQALFPASLAFSGQYPCNTELAVMLAFGKSPFSNPSAMLLHVSLWVS